MKKSSLQGIVWILVALLALVIVGSVVAYRENPAAECNHSQSKEHKGLTDARATTDNSGDAKEIQQDSNQTGHRETCFIGHNAEQWLALLTAWLVLGTFLLAAYTALLWWETKGAIEHERKISGDALTAAQDAAAAARANANATENIALASFRPRIRIRRMAATVGADGEIEGSFYIFNVGQSDAQIIAIGCWPCWCFEEPLGVPPYEGIYPVEPEIFVGDVSGALPAENKLMPGQGKPLSIKGVPERPPARGGVVPSLHVLGWIDYKATSLKYGKYRTAFSRRMLAETEDRRKGAFVASENPDYEYED